MNLGVAAGVWAVALKRIAAHGMLQLVFDVVGSVR